MTNKNPKRIKQRTINCSVMSGICLTILSIAIIFNFDM